MQRLDKRAPFLLGLIGAALIILLDQLSKNYAVNTFAYGQRLNILPIFDLTLLHNRGAAFSFLAFEAGWQRWFFSLLGLIVSGVIIYILRHYHDRRQFTLALTLILGGALGNVIDRLHYGYVIDFLLFYWRNWYYPAFNLADSAISCGAVLLVIDELFKVRRTK